MSGENILEVQNLTKHFKISGKQIVHAVDGVSFTLQKGKTLGLVGESGCGKSTILSLIAGLIQPNSGEIAVSAEIGYMLQKDHLLDWLSIKDNITLGRGFIIN